MPTLNEEKVIEETLNSIINQKNAPKYEIIIVDGGSKDNTLKIAKKYADLIVHEPKQTISAGRQAGALASSGEIIVNVNADCYYPKNWLANLIKPFENPHIIGSFGRVIPKDGDFIDFIFANTFLHPVAYVLSKINLHFVASETMAIKRSAFFRINGFNTELICGEDTDLIKRMKKYGKIVYTPNAIIYISMRRVRKWGKAYYVYFHTTNFIKMHFLNKAHTYYEPIRE